MSELADCVWTNARIASMGPAGDITDAAIAVRGGRISWVGPRRSIPGTLIGPRTREHDLEGRWITPGLVDCHTHLVHAGSPAREFAQALEGASFEELARAGGGIRATVRATRAAYDEELFEESRRRARSLLAEGVTTLEIKSGYGLDVASETKMLRVARAIGDRMPVTVRTTFLGGHAFPPDYEDDPDRFVQEICDRMLPEIAAQGLADAVDASCERVAFDLDQTERVFAAAARLGLPVKLHSDQLSNLGGTRLAARYRALSVDHLEHATDLDVAAISASGTVAVLLPGDFYFLRKQRAPPVDTLRRHHVPIAISTDCNPGSSPLTSLLLVMNLACTLFRLTPREALAGVTVNAARALGLSREVGSLEPGKWADFVAWEVEHPAELAYGMGSNPCAAVVRRGVERTPADLRQA